MKYEEITNEMLPQEVRDNVIKIAEMDSEQMINWAVEWGQHYTRWALVCRDVSESVRVERIAAGEVSEAVATFSGNEDEELTTMMITIWCLPNWVLDRIIQVHNSFERRAEQLGV